MKFQQLTYQVAEKGSTEQNMFSYFLFPAVILYEAHS